MLVASFNPGYRRGPKELKPSTRQRFVGLQFDYPEASIEAEIVATEGGLDPAMARRMVALARKIRSLAELGLAETVSTRLLVAAARLVVAGLPPRAACHAALVQPLSDDAATLQAMQDVVDLML
jgi:nitric oxide reductase NorQ protein